MSISQEGRPRVSSKKRATSTQISEPRDQVVGPGRRQHKVFCGDKDTLGTEAFVSCVAHRLSSCNDLPRDVVIYTEIREMQKLRSHEGGFLSDSDLGVSWDFNGR